MTTLRRADADDARAAADLYLRARTEAAATRHGPADDPSLPSDVRRWFAEQVVPEKERSGSRRTEPRSLAAHPRARQGLDRCALRRAGAAWAAASARRWSRSQSASGRAGSTLGLRVERAGALASMNVTASRAAERTDGRGNEERAPDVRYIGRP